MIFWILLIATILCIAVVVVMKVKGFDFDYHFGTSCVMILFVASLVITVSIMGGCILYNTCTTEAYTSAMDQRYKSITYQLENDMYSNDNEYGKKELYNQIQSWNEDLAKGKVMQDNFWLGIFYHHIYDQFEFIQLPERSIDDDVG